MRRALRDIPLSRDPRPRIVELAQHIHQQRIQNVTGTVQALRPEDTPSTHIALAILCKFMIINRLPLASITSNNVPRKGQ